MADNRITIQRKFIGLLLKDRECVSGWIDSPLTQNYFDKEYQIIISAVMDAHEQGVLLTRDSYKNYVWDNYRNTKAMLAQDVLYSNIKSTPVKPDDFPSLQARIRDSYLAQASGEYIKKFAKKQGEQGNLTAIRQMLDDFSGLVDGYEQKTQIVYENVSVTGADHIKRMDDIRSGRIKEDPILHCGIEPIDTTLHKGFTPGSLTLFCGDAGGFKSTLMLNVGANIWKGFKRPVPLVGDTEDYQSGKNVLFVPLEMPRAEIMDKLLARQTRIPTSKISNPRSLSDAECEQIKQEVESWENEVAQFYFMEYMDRTRVSVIRREIEKHIDIFQPRMVIIDYIANLMPDQSRKDRNDLEIGDMLKSLRAMAKPNAVTGEGFAIVSAAQIGREALKRMRTSQSGKITARTEDIRGSHEYSADADNIYAQFEDSDYPGRKLNFFAVKVRMGQKIFRDNQTTVGLRVQPEISLIEADDWTGMDSAAVKEGIDEPLSLEFTKPEDTKRPQKNIDKIFEF